MSEDPPNRPGIPGDETPSWSPVPDDEPPPLPVDDPAPGGPFGMSQGDPLAGDLSGGDPLATPVPQAAAPPPPPQAMAPPPPPPTQAPPAPSAHPVPFVPPAAGGDLERSGAAPAPSMAPPPVGLPATSPAYTTPPPPGAFTPHHQPMVGPYELSGWWRRAGALIIDGFIVMIAALIVMALFGAVFSVGFFAGNETGSASTVVGLLLGVLAATIVTLLYQPVIMARTDGKTFGKMATGIRVIRTNGERMDFAWAALRQVVVIQIGFGILSSFTFGLATLLDYLWPLWDSENRALHDMIVSTRVVLT